MSARLDCLLIGWSCGIGWSFEIRRRKVPPARCYAAELVALNQRFDAAERANRADDRPFRPPLARLFRQRLP
jgi:hypothetical protein